MKQVNSALVMGVGPERGLGAALARYFAQQGLRVYIAGRTEAKVCTAAEQIKKSGGSAVPLVADVTCESDVDQVFQSISTDGLPLEIVVYNVDSNLPMPILDMPTETFELLWRQNCFGAFLLGRAAIKAMLPQGRGSLFFTGATASLRARPPFTGFAAAKAGLRALAQGLAREFGPQGIHVVHTIIDGVIDGDRAEAQFPDYYKSKGKDGLLQLDAIAETYWAIHQQQKSAWTHELDLRPYQENF